MQGIILLWKECNHSQNEPLPDDTVSNCELQSLLLSILIVRKQQLYHTWADAPKLGIRCATYTTGEGNRDVTGMCCPTDVIERQQRCTTDVIER
eukprot:9559758-Ditylum_brightwellii.AAC.1